MKTEYARHLPPGWETFPRLFFALGDRTRQRILLVFDADEEICVNDIARLFHLSRPAISHHLKVLREAGALAARKRGKEVYYRLNAERCAEALQTVREFMLARSGTGTRLPATAPVSWDRGGDFIVRAIPCVESGD